MRERNVSQKDLERAGVAKQALLSVVLSSKRDISLELATFFKVSVEAFISWARSLLGVALKQLHNSIIEFTELL